jgi:hypothetical protein
MFVLRRKVPVDEAHPFGVICLSIQNADEIIKENPKVASCAINHLNSIINRNLSRFGAIRSFREGEVENSEHMNIIGMEPADMLDLAIFIQESVYKFKWGNYPCEALESVYREFDGHYGAPQLSSNYDSLWGGLRVRIGLHFGYGTVARNAGIGVAPEELGIDRHVYGGTVVKECLFIEEHAFGGQVLVSQTFRELLSRGDLQHLSPVVSEASFSSRKVSNGNYHFIPAANAEAGGKVFALQLELPAFPDRRHPTNVDGQSLTIADRAKSLQRALLFTNRSSQGETPSVESTTSNSNPMQPSGSSVQRKESAAGLNDTARKTGNKASSPRKDSVVVYEEV